MRPAGVIDRYSAGTVSIRAADRMEPCSRPGRKIDARDKRSSAAETGGK
jgi:hypothetical protein